MIEQEFFLIPKENYVKEQAKVASEILVDPPLTQEPHI